MLSPIPGARWVNVPHSPIPLSMDPVPLDRGRWVSNNCVLSPLYKRTIILFLISPIHCLALTLHSWSRTRWPLLHADRSYISIFVSRIFALHTARHLTIAYHIPRASWYGSHWSTHRRSYAALARILVIPVSRRSRAGFFWAKTSIPFSWSLRRTPVRSPVLERLFA